MYIGHLSSWRPCQLKVDDDDCVKPAVGTVIDGTRSFTPISMNSPTAGSLATMSLRCRMCAIPWMLVVG